MIREQSKSKSKKIGPKPRKASKATQDKRTDSKMRNQAKNLAKQGRYGDSELVHMSPAEVQGIASLAGRQPTINPKTGKPEMFFFLPLLAGAGAAAAAAPAVAAGAGAMAAGTAAAAPALAGGAAAAAAPAMTAGLGSLGAGGALAGGTAAAEGLGAGLAAGAGGAAEAAGAAGAATAAEAAGSAAASAPEAIGSAAAAAPEAAGSSLASAAPQSFMGDQIGMGVGNGGYGFGAPASTMPGTAPSSMMPTSFGPSGVPEMGMQAPTASAMQPGATSFPQGTGYLTSPMGQGEISTAMAKNPGFFEGATGLNGGAMPQPPSAATIQPSSSLGGETFVPKSMEQLPQTMPTHWAGGSPSPMSQGVGSLAAPDPTSGMGGITSPGAPMGSNPILPPTSGDMAAAGIDPGGMGRIDSAFDAMANAPPSSGYGTMSLGQQPSGIASLGPDPMAGVDLYGSPPVLNGTGGAPLPPSAAGLNVPPVPELPPIGAGQSAAEVMPSAGSFGGPMPPGAETVSPTISNITPKPPMADPSIPSAMPTPKPPMASPMSSPMAAPAGTPMPTPKPPIGGGGMGGMGGGEAFPMPSPKPPMGPGAGIPGMSQGLGSTAPAMTPPSPMASPSAAPMSITPPASSVPPPSSTIGSSTVPSVSTPASTSGIGSLFGGNTMQYALPAMFMANSLMGQTGAAPPTGGEGDGKSKWWDKPHTGGQRVANFNDNPRSSGEHNYFPDKPGAGKSAKRKAGGGAVTKGPQGTTPGPGVQPPSFGGPPQGEGGGLSEPYGAGGMGSFSNLWGNTSPPPNAMGGPPTGGMMGGLGSLGNAAPMAEGGMFGPNRNMSLQDSQPFGQNWMAKDGFGQGMPPPGGGGVAGPAPTENGMNTDAFGKFMLAGQNPFGVGFVTPGGNGEASNPMAMGAPPKVKGPMSAGFMGGGKPNFNQPAGRFAAGGQIQSPEKKLMAEAEAALKGEHPNPNQALSQYIGVYGENSLMDLANSLAQNAPANAPRQNPNAPHYLQGPGDGMSDSIPARGGQQDVILSDGEYIVPADVVSGLGNGSSGAGARRLDQMVKGVRVDRTGTPAQPRQINPGRHV